MRTKYERHLSALLGLVLASLPLSTAHAIQRPAHLQGHANQAGLDLNPAASRLTLRATRTHAWVDKQTTPSGHRVNFAALERELGQDLLVSIDADTGVADLLIPRGAQVYGANNSPALAEQFALGFVARHVNALAPGAAASDFVLVSNQVSNGVRTLGFVQHHAGLPIIDAQLSLSFKADHLIAVRSQALPNVWIPARGGAIDQTKVQLQARTWISNDFAAGAIGRSSVTSHGSAAMTPMTPMILPLVQAGGAIEYREVVALEVSLDQPIGRWLVYVDAATAQPIARRSLLHWAELEIDTWQRSPLGPRQSFAAAQMQVSVDGQVAFTDANGQLVVPAPSAAVSFSPQGPSQRVVNDNGPVSSVMEQFVPSQSYVWDLFADPEQDAQLSAYVHTQLVKDYVRGIDPEFAPLDLQTTVTVNISDVCNAYAEENTLNFYLNGGGCENSALIADVVYHEYGHVAHVLGLQPGVGLFNGGVSEGASDYLSASIVNDAKVGVGFFLDTSDPIRDLDPPGYEWHWPEDGGEVHDEGRIIGGTLWDLRTSLIEKYGVAQGVAKTDQIWLDGIRRSVDTPSWYMEALITNDDDGNLQNGTPDICEINEAFAAHGLYQPLGAAVDLSETKLADGSVELTLSYGTGFDACPGMVTPSALMRWRPRPVPNGPETPSTELEMNEVSPGLLRAVIPAQPEHTVTQYQVELDWGNGTVAPRPDNRADEWYEYFSGEVTQIWCADFEGAPASQGWSVDGEWSFGPPEGGGGDPTEAFSGQSVAGVALSWPGTYAPWTQSTLTSPAIDVSEHEVVRLQYRRWLNVEDGYFDQATIAANGQIAWANTASADDWGSASVHHSDREWRFHDVELTPMVGADGNLSVSFSLGSDGGLEFGGWNIDQLCIVAHEPAVPPEPPKPLTPPACGDGIVQANEQCDDGNLSNGDGCSSGCLFDYVPPEPDPEEQGWDPGGRGCGCTAAPDTAGFGGGPGGAGALALLGLLGLGVRRRRRPA
ncbi:hypothetical protein DB30_00091 [Enhygromyxa salina]|uniref:Bacillopeptidase F n=1 Tax=Enhygromyxa salina TaxID=215803 RepID=A0A0C2DIR8_9BACT|nr:DUF4215 domain-containing protein [Enhygromyxa salina]KIG19582.1 hypothetical protein DB30_00091 [Enhygromyxa salina]